MKTNLQLAITLALSFLVACAPSTELRPHDWALDVQTAETREAHEALAKHYEEVARNMLEEAKEERKMLDQYQAKPHKYGKRLQDLRTHAQAMILDLELAAKESRQMAEYHRQLAAEKQ